jgi:hypothetical protein
VFAPLPIPAPCCPFAVLQLMYALLSDRTVLPK